MNLYNFNIFNFTYSKRISNVSYLSLNDIDYGCEINISISEYKSGSYKYQTN
jgi:hypothetical protein